MLHELRAAFPVDQPAQGNAPDGLSSADDRGTLSRYVDFVLRKTALAARLEVVGEPPACLDLFRARALRAECAGETLRIWVRSLVAALDDPMPGQSDGPDGIQFLTCQKAKGLEWPVVIPIGMRREIRTRHEQFPRVERQDGATVIHFSGVTVDGDHKKARAARAAEEYQRMLYVTLTRARQLLIVPDGSALYEKQAPNFQDLARWDELGADRLFTSTASLAKDSAPPSDRRTRPGGVTWFKGDAKRLARAAEISRRIPERILPSGLVHVASRPAQAKPSGASPPAAGEETDDRLLASKDAGLASGATGGEPLAGIGGIEYGNWWHEVLQHYPWSAADGAARAGYVRRQLDRISGAAPWIERARAELTRLAASTTHAGLLARGGVFLAEMPFSHPRQAGQWVEGIMDLVVVPTGSAAIWILDWKTDRRRPSDRSEAAFSPAAGGEVRAAAPRIRRHLRPGLRTRGGAPAALLDRTGRDR